MSLRLARLLCLAVASAAPAAGAQVTFWDGPGYGGQSFTAGDTVPNFADVGYNDRAASAVVRSGSWQLCTDAYFRGRCVTLGPGQYPELGSIGIGHAISSAREMSGWPGAAPNRVVLYDGPNLYGRTYDVNSQVANLDGTGFNDRAQSMVVHEGTWELCIDAFFAGYCQVFGPGRHPNLGPLTGQLSSMRPVQTAGAPPAPAGGGWGGGSRAILFEGPNFSGRTFVINSQVVSNLDDSGFNDRASSLRVEGGYWIFCSDAHFNGECRTFGPGDYPQLGGFAYRISSGRRVNAAYPYSGSPDWSRRQ